MALSVAVPSLSVCVDTSTPDSDTVSGGTLFSVNGARALYTQLRELRHLSLFLLALNALNRGASPADTGQCGFPSHRVGIQTPDVGEFVDRCAHSNADPGSVYSAFSFNPRDLATTQVTGVVGQGPGALERGIPLY